MNDTRKQLQVIADQLLDLARLKEPRLDAIEKLVNMMAPIIDAHEVPIGHPVVAVCIATVVDGYRPASDISAALAHLVDWVTKRGNDESDRRIFNNREDRRLRQFEENNVHMAAYARALERIADALVERRGSTEFPVGQDLINEFANAKKVVELEARIESSRNTGRELVRMNQVIGDECERLQAELDRERTKPLDVEKVTGGVVDLFRQVLEKHAHQVTDGPLETIGDAVRVFENMVVGLEKIARESLALRVEQTKLKDDLAEKIAKIDRLEDLIIEEPEPKTVCCKGCPDCLGLGYSPAVLTERTREAKEATTRLAEIENDLLEVIPDLGLMINFLIKSPPEESANDVCAAAKRVDLWLERKQFQLPGVSLESLPLAADAPKMMPGQEPYTPEERSKLARLIDDAASGDPGELGEVEGNV